MERVAERERERESKTVRERKRVKKRVKQNYNFSETRLSSLPGIEPASAAEVNFEVVFVAVDVLAVAVVAAVVVVAAAAAGPSRE